MGKMGAPGRRSGKRLGPYPLMSALSAGALLLSVVVDLRFPGAGQPEALTWLILALASGFTVAPLLLGERYPRWAGFSAITIVIVLTPLLMSASTTRGDLVNHLLMLPLTACYAGWFFRRRWARSLLALGTAATAAVAILADGGVEHSMYAPLINAGLVSWLCYEGSAYLVARLQGQATVDQLTGALNRRGFTLVAARELARAQRQGHPLILAVIDFDDFKGLNDAKGHQAGDRALRESVTAWFRIARRYDVIGRWGGDEFVLLLPGMPEAAVPDFMTRLQRAAPARWSWGAVRVRDGETLAAALDRADHSLYTSKGVPRPDSSLLGP